SWEESETTPLMVRLEVDMGDGALMQWPNMQVALMLDATAVSRRVSQRLLLGRGRNNDQRGEIR
ncbi:MAG: hypothetical protein L3J83_05955, partial [Proteobacteria bacterium]|nr:hypothetical protein [Pseudomonadota bacterium]